MVAAIEKDIEGLPTIVAEETLYSWTSRYHRLKGHLRSAETSRLLFGDHYAGLRHDFPSGLRHFVTVTDGALGSAQELINKHTLLPYFLPLLETSDAREACKCLHEAHIGGLKYRLGLPASRFRAHHPLKTCLACLKEDNDHLGFSYWHVAHQWPGSWVCTKHNESLLPSVYKVNGIQRFQWLLPDAVRLQPLSAPEVALSLDLTHILSRLSQLSNDWSTDSNFRNGAANLRSSYVEAFRDRGWVTSTGRIRLRHAAADLAAHLFNLHRISEFRSLPSNVDQAYTQLTRLLGVPRKGTHPLRHIILIEWLFTDWNHFKRQLQAAKPFVLPPEPEPLTTKPLISATRYSGAVTGNFELSTDSGSNTSKDVTEYAGPTQASTRKVETQTRRRPKKLKGPLLTAVVHDLAHGIDKSIVTFGYGISIVTVNRLLKADPDLDRLWRTRNHLKKRNKRRDAWKNLLRQHNSLGIKKIRLLAPADYLWLYRHDRTWLERINRRIAPLPRSNNAHTDWLERDRSLAAKVVTVTAALAHRDGRHARSVKTWELCAEIPELRARLATPGKLPETLKAIDRAANRS